MILFIQWISIVMVGKIMDTLSVCRYCGSADVIKYGRYKEAQRYFCKACGRKFRSGNLLYRMRMPLECVAEVLERYYQGTAVRDIRAMLNKSYGFCPNKSVTYGWIKKYTCLSQELFKTFSPSVGDKWIAEKTQVELQGNHKVYIYDYMDEKTRFLLASHVSLVDSVDEELHAYFESIKLAGNIPDEIFIDRNKQVLEKKEFVINNKEMVVRKKPENLDLNYELIERFTGIFGDRKMIRPFRNISTFLDFNRGWMIHYNFFKPNKNIGGRTPAQAAGFDKPVKSWSDFLKSCTPL